MITRPASCVDPSGRVRMDALESILKEHGKNRQRLEKLWAYYSGGHDIEKRQRTSGLPNNRLVHAYPRYITTMAAGYLIGSPVSYALAEKEMNTAFIALLDAYDQVNMDSVDSELAKHASIYGKGIELAYATEEAKPRTSTLDPKSAFVVYEDTVESKPLLGVYYFQKVNEKGELDGYRITVYTDASISSYDTDSLNSIGTAQLVADEKHYFGAVPMTEFWNNEEEKGDFEPVMSLIDAYNVLQSDRINDKEQFVDALLVLCGVMIGDETGSMAGDEADKRDERPVGQQLREEKVIQFSDDKARVEWLSKQLNEADVEVLKDALKTDIHKMSMVPDLSDENFAGNSSGVAMRYKLLGLEQMTKIKERWFREALQSRMKLFSNFLAVKGAPALDTGRVQITFSRALPNNDVETAQMVSGLQDIVPNEMLIKQLSFVEDVEAALELLSVEQKARDKRQKELFNDYPDANAQKQDDEERGE